DVGGLGTGSPHLWPGYVEPGKGRLDQVFGEMSITGRQQASRTHQPGPPGLDERGELFVARCSWHAHLLTIHTGQDGGEVARGPTLARRALARAERGAVAGHDHRGEGQQFLAAGVQGAGVRAE